MTITLTARDDEMTELEIRAQVRPDGTLQITDIWNYSDGKRRFPKFSQKTSCTPEIAGV